jgi:hypothetical protein
MENMKNVKLKKTVISKVAKEEDPFSKAISQRRQYIKSENSVGSERSGFTDNISKHR